jgi:hypothetical protein
MQKILVVLFLILSAYSLSPSVRLEKEIESGQFQRQRGKILLIENNKDTALDGLDFKNDRQNAIKELKARRAKSQKEIINILDNLKKTGEVSDYTTLWLSDIIVFDGSLNAFSTLLKMHLKEAS